MQKQWLLLPEVGEIELSLVDFGTAAETPPYASPPAIKVMRNSLFNHRRGSDRARKRDLRVIGSAALASCWMALPQPVQAQPSVPTFARDDAGIMGCQGQAAPRGAKAWSPRVYAIWALGESTVVMSDGQTLRSHAYERSDVEGRTSMSWRIPGYSVELTFSTKRTGYETSGGNGAMRVFSGTGGDSVSIPVRVDEGC